MPDALTTITNLINSPPGQLVAGGVFAGIVWKFFDKVEAVLTDDTKLEIAVWLLGVKTAEKVKTWPETFAKLFNRVFGTRHFSVKCAVRSCIGSLCALVVAITFISPQSWISFGATVDIKTNERDLSYPYWPFFALSIVVGLFAPDFVSLLETRWMLKLLRLHSSVVLQVTILGVDAVVTAITAVVGAKVGGDFAVNVLLQTTWRGKALMAAAIPSLIINDFRPVELLLKTTRGIGFDPPNFYLPALMFFPGCVSCLWLWLYAVSGFLLKFARRFDIGFQWFNRKFDIEKKPLSAIGLVAGALVAVMYWGFAVGWYLMKK